MSDKPSINLPWPKQAYARGYLNDIFISYRSANNLEGWVTSFHQALERKIYEILGASDFKIWRDDKIGGVDDFNDAIRFALCGRYSDKRKKAEEQPEQQGGSAIFV